MCWTLAARNRTPFGLAESAPIASTIVRRLLLVLGLVLIPISAFAQDGDGGIDVVNISGPLDSITLDFIVDSMDNAVARGQVLVVFELGSRGALDEDGLRHVASLLEEPPIPVAVWVGPAPADAFGGAAQLTLIADQAAIAPNARIGKITPTITGDDSVDPLVDGSLIETYQSVLSAEDTGLELQPTIRQFLQDLNGRTFPTVEGDVEVTTIREFTQDGESGVTLLPVTFIKPGLVDRFFRLGIIPEAAFFFLVVGLTIITFEFFAIGPGLAAATGAVSLTIAGWGITNLPVQWWALSLAILGWAILTGSYQRGGVVVLTLLGAALLQVGGMFFVDGSGQLDPRWWLVLPSVLAVLFFFLLAMPTVQRARFSTQVLGRDSLVGAKGTALVDFDPEGLVEVNGARWRATAHREAGLVEGAEVIVTGVDGLFLEVDPAPLQTTRS